MCVHITFILFTNQFFCYIILLATLFKLLFNRANQRRTIVPRKPSIWNYLPKSAYTGRNEVTPHEVLTAWGVEDWGREGSFFDAEYVGWCLVHLPEGWTISLEQYDLFLLDYHGQVRGVIHDAFERRKGNEIIITKQDIKDAGISEEEWAEAFPPDRPDRKEPEKPHLVLRTAIRFQDSSSGGDTHSFWAENPMGEHLFGIYDEPVTREEFKEKIPKLVKRVSDWMDEHYPDWQDHTAYWDAFVEMDERWSLAQHDIDSVAENLLAGKSDEDLRTLRAEMGTGERYTDYLVSLQLKLAEMFGKAQDMPPFYIAANIAWRLKLEIYQRTGIKFR